MRDLRDLSLQELRELLLGMGEKKFRSDQIYDWLHKRLVSSYDEMLNIPKELRERLEESYNVSLPEVLDRLESRLDGTRKYIFRFSDGNIIESVFMRYKTGNSVCISSQAGCRMGCRFCASTLDGLSRNLTSGEMLSQLYSIRRDTGERISNVVVMGSGEPLDNYDNLISFIKMLSGTDGISQRNITVSTCGIVPNIKRLKDEDLNITLALSLHAANDETRKKLMPIANKYGIHEVMESVYEYFEKTKRRVTLEYSVVQGVNDSFTEAELLSRLIKSTGPDALKAFHVNVIPVNPIKERQYERPSMANIYKFIELLNKSGINATKRREMGSDISGACGQLRRKYNGLSH